MRAKAVNEYEPYLASQRLRTLVLPQELERARCLLVPRFGKFAQRSQRPDDTFVAARPLECEFFRRERLREVADGGGELGELRRESTTRCRGEKTLF